MGFTARSLLRELDDALSALHASDNSTFGTPAQTTGMFPLDRRLERVAETAGRLVSKGRREDVVATLDRWRAAPIEVSVLGNDPATVAELPKIHALYAEVSAGRAELDPSWANGSEMEQVRYFTIKHAIDRQARWSGIVDDVARRAGL